LTVSTEGGNVAETTYRGFAPYIQMVDSGELKPGQTIAVGPVDYVVLPPDLSGKQPVYRASEHPESRRNVRNLLKNKEWYVKEA